MPSRVLRARSHKPPRGGIQIAARAVIGKAGASELVARRRRRGGGCSGSPLALVNGCFGSETDIVQNVSGTTRIDPVARDDFTASIKEALAKRVAFRCSNRECGTLTVGPHAQADRVVNVGVAAHIGAASPKGPRFESSQSAAERTSIDNAVWLCQTCAKLVDSDVDSYPAARLRGWKVEAEASTLRSLGARVAEDYYPQPAASQHSPMPRIAGQPFAAARKRLLVSGWQPLCNQWSYANNPRIEGGNGPLMWARGYHELTDASGTGLAYCKFRYRDAYGSELVLVTAGELFGDHSDVPVWSWSIQMREEMVSQGREFSRLSWKIRGEIDRALDRTNKASRARRDLAMAAGALGGSRERLYREEVETRNKHIDAVAHELQQLELGSDDANQGHSCARLETLLARVTSISERSAEDAATFESERTRLVGRG
jgi:hypothetical protein